MQDERELDIVVYGATGFVGRLTARYLAGHAPAGVKVGLAGRNRGKLEAVRRELGGPAASWPLGVADSSDPSSLDGMARSTAVVVTTVGPYAKYGLDVVGACARAGTHYCDLTGEVLFVRDSIDRWEATARESGARIVHSCGYDSIPSDLGVLMLHRAAESDGAGELDEVVHKAWIRGGFSGGTIDSFRNQVDTIQREPAKQSIVMDPYALSPDRAAEADLGPQPDLFAPHRDALLGEWVAPFVMSSFNTRIVRRSNALTGWSYGPHLRYREVMGFGSGPAGPVLAAAVTGGVAAMGGGMAFPATRWLLDRVLPEPGEGPSQKTMDNGSFRSDFHGRTSSGRRYHSVVAGDGDPGYKATAVMLGESSLALASDLGSLPDMAGILTPATALGTVLVERLRNAGFRIDSGPGSTPGPPTAAG